jgi:uncharacterized protein YdhG (YjbR/CyaY superfamily)
MSDGPKDAVAATARLAASTTGARGCRPLCPRQAEPRRRRCRLAPALSLAPVTRLAVYDALVSSQEVDAYLTGLDEPERATLQELRKTIASIVPGADEGMAYGAPVFRLRGKAVAGFAAFKNHLSYLPHSRSVLAALQHDVTGYATSKGALQFPIDRPLPKTLVKKLISVRLVEIGQR